MLVSLKMLYNASSPVSRREYLIWLAVFWVYALMWFVAIFIVNVMWSGSMAWKILANACAVVLAPSAADLFRSFDAYLEEFDRKIAKSMPPPQL